MLKGSSFNPAAPGPIGGTTPNAITTTGITFSAAGAINTANSSALDIVSTGTTFRYYFNLFGPLTPAAADLGSNGNGSVLGWKRLYLDYTNTATVGAVTINKASGRVNIAAAGTSVVVTNSLVTAASHVVAWMSSADATGRVTSVVPAAGSFTINTVAVTGQASFDFLLINTD